MSETKLKKSTVKCTKSKQKSNSKHKPKGKHDNVSHYVNDVHENLLFQPDTSNVHVCDTEVDIQSENCVPKVQLLDARTFENTLRVKIGNVSTTALVDTGATLSIANLNLLNKLHPKFIKNLPSDYQKIFGVGNIEQQLTGKVQLTLDIEGTKFTQTFHTLQNNYPLILGMDFIKSHKAEISYKTSTIALDDVTYKLYPPPTRSTLAKTVKHEIIMAFTAADIPVRLHKPVTTGCMILEPLASLTKLDPGLEIAPSVVNSQLTACRIVNDTDTPISIPCGCAVAIGRTVPASHIAEYVQFLETADDDEVDLSENEDKMSHGDHSDPKFEIKNPKFTPEEIQDLTHFLLENKQRFSTTRATLGKAHQYKYRIETGDEPPIVLRYYRTSPKLQRVIDAEIQALLRYGLIQPSTSQWQSPVVCVRKATHDGSDDVTNEANEANYRLACDYRAINKIIKTENYPIPRLEDIWDMMGEHKPKIWSCLDLKAGFQQIPLDDETKHKSAFVTRTGKFVWNYLPYGIKTAPAFFTMVLTDVLRDLLNTCCILYIDDIICFSDSVANHKRDLQKIFDRLEKAGLTLNPAKCQFFQSEVKYLGHILSEEGVKPNPKLVQVIKQYPAPKSVKHVRQFLGVSAYYRRFQKNYSNIAKPLHNLLKKDSVWNWDDTCQKAFEILKTNLINPPILAYADLNKPFIMTTDASDFGLGYILSQKQGPDNLERVICYSGRALTKAEQAYGITEREALAVVQGFKEFHCYLHGNFVTVVTDHKALEFIHGNSKSTGRVARWAIELQNYDFEVKHRKGSLIGNADAISRLENLPGSDIETPATNTQQSAGVECKQQSADAAGKQETADPVSEHQSADLHRNMPPGSEASRHTASVCSSQLSETLQGCILTSTTPHSHTESLQGDTVSQPDTDELERHEVLEISFMEDSQHINEFHTAQAGIDIKKEQMNCPEIGPLYHFIDTGDLPPEHSLTKGQIASADQYAIKDGVLIHLFQPRTTNIEKYNPIIHQVVIPKSLRSRLLNEYHDSIFGGHQAFSRVYAAIRQKYFWPKMYTEIFEYQRSCLKCQQASHHHPKPPPLHPLPVPGLFARWSMDFIGPLKKSACGKRWILLCVDHFSKWSEAFALENADAVTVAKTLYAEIFCRYGSPRALLSDRGASFLSTLVKALCEIFNVKRQHTTPYNPSTNGLNENRNLFVNKALRAYVNDNQEDWPKFIPGIMLAYRSTPATNTTEFSPYFLLFGTEFVSPIDTAITPNTEVAPQYRENIKSFIENVQLSRYIARENLLRHQEYNKTYFDQSAEEPSYKIGDYVWLFNPRVPVGYSKKLRVKWVGPYQICEIGPNHTYRLRHYQTRLVTDTLINARRLKPARLHTESRIRQLQRVNRQDRGVVQPDQGANEPQQVNRAPEDINNPNQGQGVNDPQQRKRVNSQGRHQNTRKDKMTPAVDQPSNRSKDQIEKVINLAKDLRGKWYQIKFKGIPQTSWYLEGHIDIPKPLIEECLRRRTWDGKPRKKKKKKKSSK